MDSVPYEFCHDVFWTLCKDVCSCKKMAKNLTGLWKSAAEEYANNAIILSVTIWKEADGEWMCSPFDGGSNKRDPKTMDELLSMDRRFIAQTVLRLWLEGAHCGYIYGPIGVTRDELMEIAVPADITTSEEVHPIRGNRVLCITWSKPDGSYIQCDVDYDDRTVRFRDLS
ncbi:hypothetical protein QR680_010731 [Steinernema hermaphroditum]|uniref:Uncharacterized protein n=1 Tax=Steinernema hermaphroditum TaxID=289476 RepID=A0AA39IRD5_9BILA|nr:hypothetical protein QR680_010731 [Steinernema hermaphroditum]